MTDEGAYGSGGAYRALSEIIADIHEHRRRMETLLARLDDLCRAASFLPEAGARVDLPALLTHFRTNLRTDDGRLDRLVALLERHSTAVTAGSGL